MAVSLREIIASFAVDFDKDGALQKGDKQIDGLTDKLKGFGKWVAGAFAVNEIVAFSREILGQADVLAKQSGALGVSTRWLQGWQHAAGLSGSSAEEFTASFTKLTRNVAEAGDSAAGPAAAAFKALGVSVKDASGQLAKPEDLLDGVVAGLERLEDPAKRTQIVMDLFGKSGAKLLPLLGEGTDAIAKMRAEVDELGFAFDDAFLEDAQEVNDNIDRMKLGLRGLAIQVLGPILPGLVKITQGAVKAAKGFVGWIKQTTAVRAVLSALTLKGVLALASAIPQLIARFGGLGVILRRVAVLVARVVAPFLLLDDVIGFLSGDDSLIGRGLDKAFGPGTQENVRALIGDLMTFFGLFKSEPDKVRASFATLPDDLAKDLGGFGSFLGGWGQSIVDVGLFAVNALTGGWQNFVSKAKAAGDGLLLALKIIWTEVKFAGLAAAAALSDAFDGVWNSVISGAQSALDAMIDVLAKLPGTADAVKGLREKVKSLDSSKGTADAGDFVSKQRDQARLGLASEYDRIGAVATAPATAPGGTTNNNTVQNVAPVTTIHVTVPPGEGELGNRVGKATAKAAAPANLRAIKAALVPTPG